MSETQHTPPPGDPSPDSADDAVLEASRRSADAVPGEIRRTRPPTWLIVLTVMIPLAIGTVWWKSSWLNTLTPAEITHALEGSDAHQQARALASFTTIVDEYVASKRKNAESAETRGYQAQVDGCRSQVLEFGMKREFVTPEVIPHVVRTLGYFSALGSISEQSKARDALEHFLTHSTQHVRFQAATSLSMYGDRSFAVIDTLKSMLEEGDQSVVSNAVVALGKVGDASTAPLLKRIANRSDLDPDIRQIAQAAHDASSARSPQAP